MQYTIQVKTNAKKNAVEASAVGLRVLVKAPPQEGRANEAVIETLAEHFRVPKNHIVIIRGFTSKHKVVRVGG